MGVASGWNLWVWVVGIVRRYIDFLIILLIRTPLVLALLASLLLFSFFKCFFVLVYVIFVKI